MSMYLQKVFLNFYGEKKPNAEFGRALGWGGLKIHKVMPSPTLSPLLHFLPLAT